MLESFSLRPDIVARFWAKVDVREPNDCWPWTGALGSGGYGQAWTGRDAFGLCFAHRVSAFVAGILDSPRRESPEDEALHSCDNPPCCNPSHLSRGTRIDNVRDAIQKGRFRYPPRRTGDDSAASRLTATDVHDIRGMLADGETRARIALLFGVASSTVDDIASGRTWGHLNSPSVRDPGRSEEARVRRALRRRRIGKLGPGDFDRIMTELAAGRTQRAIAASLGVNQTTVSKIKRGVRLAWCRDNDIRRASNA